MKNNETLIEKLKLLGIALTIAEEYDSVPLPEETDKILETFNFKWPEMVNEACKQYLGYSPYDIRSEIKSTIDKLT